MTLPKRLYYTLDKAASELGCDISDIIHFVANGYANLCIKYFETNHQPPNEELPHWESNLLINYKRVSELVNEHYSMDGKFTISEDGAYLAEDDINFEYVNSYVRLFGKIHFWMEKESLSVCDAYSGLFDLKGLLQIPNHMIYNNEYNLLKGGEMLVEVFELPIDNTHSIPEGRFFDYVSEFSNDDWLIDKDDKLLMGNLVSNNLKKLDGPETIFLDDLLITADELEKLKCFDNMSQAENKNIAVSLDSNLMESPKALAKYSELLHAMISLCSDFKDVDVRKVPVSRWMEMLQQVSAKKGVDLPELHPQTLAKYLGRNRMRK